MENKESQPQQAREYSLSQENQRFSGARKFHFPGLKLEKNHSKRQDIKPNLSNKEFKVVFINLHGDTNMTASYLHSLISKNRFDIHTIHFRRLILDWKAPPQNDLDALKKAVDEINPRVICMSVNSMSFGDAIAVSNMFKEKIIIWGGVQPLIDPESCLKYINIIVRGEGDETIIELLNALKKGKKIDKIKNVWVKKGRKIIKNDFRPLIQNLDELPFPDYSDKNKKYILGGKIYNKNPLPLMKYSYPIAFSRGCPFSCTYCINHYYNKTFGHKYLRKRSVESVIKELLYAKEQFPKLKSISFWDDIFLIDIRWLKEFVKEYKEKINLPFFAYGNATFINETNVQLLKEAGINLFDLGLQSGSERIRTTIFGRIDRDEKILEASKIIHKYKIPVAYDIIFSEFETEEDMKIGIDFLLKLKKPFKVQRNRLAYYPNFEITKRALKEKKIDINQVASKNLDIRTQLMNSNDAVKYPLMIYYYFLGKKYIPNSFITYMFDNKWHEKHSAALNKTGNFIEKIENLNYSVKSMLTMALRGEFDYIYSRLMHKGDYF